MKAQEINEIIAINQGWDMDPPEAHGWASRGKWCQSPSGQMLFVHAIPKYCDDLNAMHEAEKIFDFSQAVQYGNQIHAVCDASSEAPDFDFMAPAHMRAEAFLKTLGKWKEEA